MNTNAIYLSSNLQLFLFCSLFILAYLGLLSFGFTQFIRHHRRRDIIQIIGIKGLPILFFLVLLSKNHAFNDLISVVVGTTFGFLIFLILFLKKRSI